MPTDRVLIEIVTAANMTGIKEAQAGLLGLTSGMTAAVVGLGLAVIAGKSIIDITEKREKADNDLAQAIKAQGGNLKDAHAFLGKFLDTNRAYYNSQSEVIDSYARLTRSGLTAAEVQKDMGRILDMSAISGRSVEDVTTALILAEHGRLKGLSDLGVTTTKFIDAQGNQVASSHDVAKALAEVDARSAHGRDTLNQTAQATNSLGNSWQDIVNIAGPPLVGLLDDVLKSADWVLHSLKQLGENKEWNKMLHDSFGGLQHDVQVLLAGAQKLKELYDWASGHRPSTPSQMPQGPTRGPIHAASGFSGMVTSPTLFLAGEAGREHVSISPKGGGGSRPIEIHIHGSVYSDGPGLDRLSMAIANRLSYVTGR